MKYKEFEEIISADRMRRYVLACGGNEQKGRTLYRYNMTLSSEMLKIISCFEVTLRNQIDRTQFLPCRCVLRARVHIFPNTELHFGH